MHFNSHWIYSEVGGTPGVQRLFLMSFKQFQMELESICSDSCLDLQCFDIGGELTVKLWMLILNGWNLTEGKLKVFKRSP